MQVRVTVNQPWQYVLFGLIYTVIGVGLGIFAINSITTYNENNSKFVETVAEVIEYDYNDDGLRAIIVEYEVDGDTYTKISNSYSRTPKSIGTEVGIKYNPTDPRDAIWVFDSTNIVLPIFSVIFTITGIYVIVIGVKKMENGEEYM